MTEAVERHRTAISRSAISRPIRLALEAGLLAEQVSFFDYGCGQGDDLRLLEARGIAGTGWDPNFKPNAQKQPADVVNLGYVVNVIEDPKERSRALKEAWALAKRMLIVAARTQDEMRDLASGASYSDGVLTSRNTFQKFFEQSELKSWVDNVLGAASVAAGLGILFVFRDDAARESFLASRYRRAAAAPRVRVSDALFEKYKDLLQPLMIFVSDRGRIPWPDELKGADQIADVFGSIKVAFSVVRRVTGAEGWKLLAAERKQDLELYLALARFDRRARWSDLPPAMQHDVRTFFGNYTAACASADELLLSVGKAGEVDRACSSSAVGKLTPTALYVHRTALPRLPHLLRAFEGCARGYVGDVEGATLIKLYRTEPKVSYLSYPRFDVDPHPRLAFSLNVNLRDFRLKKRRYSGQANQPVLHRKETFVADDHPLRGKFARLTKSEEAHGLLDQTDVIGLSTGWENVLREKGLTLRGHRLISRK